LCRGYTIPAAVLEKAVIGGVRTMLNDKAALHRAIAIGRTGRAPVEDGGIFTAEDRGRLQQQIQKIERYRDRLWQRHLDQIRTGKRTNSKFLQAELEKLNKEIETVQRQLTIDQQLRRRPRQLANSSRRRTPSPPC